MEKLCYFWLSDLYQICLRRCTERLERVDQRDRSGKERTIIPSTGIIIHALIFCLSPSDSTKSLSREGSVEVIYLDVQRTFPTLGFFQEVGRHATCSSSNQYSKFYNYDCVGRSLSFNITRRIGSLCMLSTRRRICKLLGVMWQSYDWIVGPRNVLHCCCSVAQHGCCRFLYLFS